MNCAVLCKLALCVRFAYALKRSSVQSQLEKPCELRVRNLEDVAATKRACQVRSKHVLARELRPLADDVEHEGVAAAEVARKASVHLTNGLSAHLQS